MAKERIGILGGTFDPIHEGHIHMALSAMQGAHLDRVLVLPTGNPPHKIGITPAEDRWRMVCCACVKPGKIPNTSRRTRLRTAPSTADRITTSSDRTT